MIRIVIAALILMSIACSRPADVALEEGINHFGLVISEDGSTNIPAAVAALGSEKEFETKISGTISAVCQSKGCWMTLNGQDEGEEVFIKFKDYAFFVPKDAAGQKAIVQGILSLEETSVDELRHYAEDEGASEAEIAAITAPVVELKMMAEGVIIYN